MIAWAATTAGILGQMVRDLMVVCVERRFSAARAPAPVQRFSDNGSPYAAAKTIELATALGLTPCFTPIKSPESNGMAKAFVLTLKRDYVRVSALSTTAAALSLLPSWTEDYNDVRPQRTFAYCTPREYIAHSTTPMCPV